MAATATAASYKGIIKAFNAHSGSVRDYFALLPNLVSNYPYEVSLAYRFLQTERAHNRCLYGGVVKLHRADAKVADSVINDQHLTRDGFLELYRNVFGIALSQPTRDLIRQAEKTRDKVIHGKKVLAPQMRQAICEVLDYAQAVNQEVAAVAGFEPFGDMTGFKGAAQGLDPRTTRWLLKGIGFALS
jgi:hypothetical protein